MMDIIFWDLLILYQIFFSPQVKRSVIISNEHGIYELPDELPNDLRFEKISKQNYNPVPSPPPKTNLSTL